MKAKKGQTPVAGSEITNGGSRRAAMIVLKGLEGPVKRKGQQMLGSACNAAVGQNFDRSGSIGADVLDPTSAYLGAITVVLLRPNKLQACARSSPAMPPRSMRLTSWPRRTKICLAVKPPAPSPDSRLRPAPAQPHLLSRRAEHLFLEFGACPPTDGLAVARRFGPSARRSAAAV